MSVKLEISDWTFEKLLNLQATEAWRNGNYTRIEDRVNCLRYLVYDRIMTEIMQQVENMQAHPLIK